MSADYIPSDFGDLSGTVAASQLPASGVTAGTYTLATVTVDTHGRVTAAAAGSAGGGIGSAVTSGQSGSVLYVDASGDLAQDNLNLYYDAVNKRFGVGTKTPRAGLDVCKGGGSIGATVLHFCTTDTTKGGYVSVSGDAEFLITAGCEYFDFLSDYVFTQRTPNGGTSGQIFSVDTMRWFLKPRQGEGATFTPDWQMGLTAGRLAVQANSSTTQGRDAGGLKWSLTSTTDNIRKGSVRLFASDWTGIDREGVNAASDGTQVLLGFFGATPVARPATPVTLADVIALLQALGLCS